MASPGPANSLLSRASFANGDVRYYSRESTYSLFSTDGDRYTSNERRDWDVETVKDLGDEQQQGSGSPSELRYDGYVRSLQEENQRLEGEMRRKEEEVKRREEEIKRKDEQVKKAEEELQKMRKETKKMAEEEARRKEREIGQDANRKNEEEAGREINKKEETLRAKEQKIEERERAVKAREEELERREDLWRAEARRKKEDDVLIGTLMENVENVVRLQKEASRQSEKDISPAQKIVERFNRQQIEAGESAFRPMQKNGRSTQGGINESRRNKPVLPPDNYIPNAGSMIPPPPPPPAVWLPPIIPQRDQRAERKPIYLQRPTPKNKPLPDTHTDNYIPVLNNATIAEQSHPRKRTSKKVKYPDGALVIPPQSSATIPPLPTITGVLPGFVPHKLKTQPTEGVDRRKRLHPEKQKSNTTSVVPPVNNHNNNNNSLSPNFDLLSPLTDMANLKLYPPGFTPAQPTRPM